MAESGDAEWGNRALGLWTRLGRTQQIAVSAIVAVSALAAVIILSWARSPEYATAFANLSEQDAAAIVAKLKEAKTPYELASDGSAIRVPSNVLYDTRLQLASAGLPQGGGVGFELFNQTSFGMTDFVQKVNYQRALEGELSRTINHLGPVEESRVHIVIPQPSLYTDQQRDTTASVVLKLKAGQQLKDAQIRGIAQLVSSSVEGLTASNLTIVDANGNVLSDGLGSAKDGTRASTAQLDKQRTLEADVEQRVQSMLDRVVGSGKAIVRVKALMDWDAFESSSEVYSPAGSSPQLRSSRETVEKSSDPSGQAGGVPGLRSGVAASPTITEPVTAQGQFEKRDTTSNYELSKTIEKVTRSPGAVKRLSVAVVLDAAERIEGAQLDELNKLVAAAAGIDASRGDVLAISSLAYNRKDVAVDARAIEEDKQWEKYYGMARIGALGLGPALLLLFLFILTKRSRGIRSRSIAQIDNVERPRLGMSAEIKAAMDGAEGTRAALPARATQDSHHHVIMEQVTTLARTQPHVMVSLIKTWMKEDERYGG